MQFSCKLGERKIKGRRKTKLLKHILALSSSDYLTHFLARYACSITLYFHPPIRGRGTYTAGTVVRLTVSFLNAYFLTPKCTKLHIYI